VSEAPAAVYGEEAAVIDAELSAAGEYVLMRPDEIVPPKEPENVTTKELVVRQLAGLMSGPKYIVY
jgi:hypothetical protein